MVAHRDPAALARGPDAAPAAAASRSRAATAPFNLVARFSMTSLAIIALVTAVSAMLLSRFLVESLLNRDAEVAAGFVQIMASGPRAETYFAGGTDAADAREVEAFFARTTAMPDVLRAHVYDTTGRVIWSSVRESIGTRLENPERDRALAGRLVVEADILEHRTHVKPEHVLGESLGGSFVENYIPVWNRDRTRVIGVIELYKQPRALLLTVQRGLQRIWLFGILGAILIYGVLIWIVRRADRVMRAQHAQLVRTATTSAVGELAAAVAHSIRNPLAVIRSSAELITVLPDGSPAEQAGDIIVEVDRVESWIRGLLVYTQTPSSRLGPVDLNALARDELDGFAREIERRRVKLDVVLSPALPRVRTDTTLLTHVLRTLVGNALDATGPGGGLVVSTRALAARDVEIEVKDTGCGMSADDLERVFVPFRTGKKHGLGIGLPLVRRTLERIGGAVRVESRLGVGTTVTIRLPGGIA
jgi:signal transduction histidine kinase